MAAELRHRLQLDCVMFVPAGDPPHKPDQPVTPPHHRINMLECAIAAHDVFSIDRVDLDRRGPSYTRDTLAVLTERSPGDRFVFLMGEDSLRDLHTWKDPERILEIAKIGVGARPEVHVDIEDVYLKLPTARGRIDVVNIPLIGISSREIRRRVAAGEPISFQVPELVEQYIQKNGLYRLQASSR